jgi:hypothetical protein
VYLSMRMVQHSERKPRRQFINHESEARRLTQTPLQR